MLQACASYEPDSYGPIRPDEYYTDNLEYRSAFEEATPDVSAGFAGASYYPWWSMDYFYLGSHAYRPNYWPAPRYNAGYRPGYPPGYWPYYGFYSPFYYPYSTYAWYDPWTGFPRYGIGTNLFWREYSSWASSNGYRSVTRDRQYGNSRYGSSYQYRDPFYDVRDRSGIRPAGTTGLSVTSATRSGTMQVRSRADTKIRQSHTGSVSSTSSPGISRSSSRSVMRPSVSSSRPPTIPQPRSSASSQTSTTVKKHKQ